MNMANRVKFTGLTLFRGNSFMNLYDRSRKLYYRKMAVREEALYIDCKKAGLAIRHPLELAAFRFDIRVKYLYGRTLLKGEVNRSKALYRRHLEAWNDFSEHNGDNPSEKVGFERFDSDYQKLLHDIGNNNFDWNFSPVPIVDGYPVNGAHRIAACLCHKIMVPCQYQNYEGRKIQVFNEEFFEKLVKIDRAYIEDVNKLYEEELMEHYNMSLRTFETAS